MYASDLSAQTLSFLYSLICGGLLGALYSLFKCIRYSFGNRKIPTLVSDVIYMLLFTLITYLFSIAFTSGRVRYITLLGEAVGLILINITLGKLIFLIFSKMFLLIRKSALFVLKNIAVIVKKLLKAVDFMLYNIVNKNKFLRKSGKEEIYNAASRSKNK